MNSRNSINFRSILRAACGDAFLGTMRSAFPVRLSCLVVWLGAALAGQAQWLTQNLPLRPGWNAVYLHVDLSHTNLLDLVGRDASNPIQEIWLWNVTPSAAEFLVTPSTPSDSGTEWITWKRSQAATSKLQRLVGNTAYLVRLANDAASTTWAIKGKPVPPQYQWTSSGLNFLDLPVIQGQGPTYQAFLSEQPGMLQAEIYRYTTGELGDSNPYRVDPSSETLVRGEAVWIRANGAFNRYFGPFELELPGSKGVEFGDSIGQMRIRVRNVTARTNVVTVQLLNSESAPAGQTAIRPDLMPMLVRGERDQTTLKYAFTNLLTPQSWTLSPKGREGSATEVVLGINRSAMTGNAGDLYAGILRFTDSLNHSQVDVPVSAIVASTQGLWVGQATVNAVNTDLVKYKRATNAAAFASIVSQLDPSVTYQWQSNSGMILISGGPNKGRYVEDGRISSKDVARPFPLRLILHDDGANIRLLRQVYHGYGKAENSSNLIVTTSQEQLDPGRLTTARRISAVHLPASGAIGGWRCDGKMLPDSVVTTADPVSSDFDDADNPFVHNYHPDHDNLDATFKERSAQGQESYTLNRRLALGFAAAGDDFETLTAGSSRLVGNYSETVTLLGRLVDRGGGNVTTNSRTYPVSGSFLLNRISSSRLFKD
ncbi:MAG: hypothetical protein JNN07_14705 [Verrucomicrobiales bacterium]|nr:hypothetical protein [Verrucomicrobiales bacterium]